MSALQLDVPNLTVHSASSSAMETAELQSWLDGLHLTDVEKSTRSVIDTINQYNQSTLDPIHRIQFMDQFIPVVTQLLESLRGKLKGSPFPLSNNNLERAELVIKMMEAMANGYKISILDLDAGKGDQEQASTASLKATFFSIKYLAEQLLSAWLIYYPEPQGVWAQIHRLYRYAEETGMHDKVLPAQVGENLTANTILHMYKRIVLLAISNPYHLMEGEASAILDYLRNWATKCTITPHTQGAKVTGQFYVDLESGDAPRFASDHIEHKPKQGRIIGVDALAAGLANLIHKITEQSRGKNMSLKDRMNRDMLIRLQNAWGGRADRQEQRSLDSENVLLSVGLGASHYFVSGLKNFEPEKDEIISGGGSSGLESGLSLVPLEEDGWKKQELKDKMESGVTQHRVSTFDDNSADTWQKINATKAYHQSIVANKIPEFKSTEWSKFNESQGGLGLTSSDISNLKIRVGDLISFSKDSGNSWRLGASRWLMNKNNQTLDLGIKTISESALAVGVRAISGVGEGGEYFRAFVCSTKNNSETVQTVIVPANIFDIQSELVLSQDGNIEYIHLQKLIDTTSSYSQFQFETIAKPDGNPYLNKYLQG